MVNVVSEDVSGAVRGSKREICLGEWRRGIRQEFPRKLIWEPRLEE